MKVKLILPALTEAKSEYWRSIKYSLFPPLGLATLAGYLTPEDKVEIVDEHVENLNLDDQPDLVGIEVYITSAHRSYGIADTYRSKGVHVVLGGLHVTCLPDEAAAHADTIITGPAEEAWPRFLDDFRDKKPGLRYSSRTRNLESLPLPDRRAIKKQRYLAPNSVVVSRGCPHSCSFCYKDSFYRGGKSFYHVALDRALEEIDSLSGKHLFFLDDNILGNPVFSRGLFSELAKRDRIWQGAATISATGNVRLIEQAAESGCRSLFIGFESINQESLRSCGKLHNLPIEYERNIRILRSNGIMVNASFIFGMDDDDKDVFQRTVDWAVENSIETATFHILTPYPGTQLFREYSQNGRIRSWNWDDYDTRHLVFEHPRMSKGEMEDGYWGAYESFYSWRSILDSAKRKEDIFDAARHLAYAGGWKKCEGLWSLLVRLKKVPLAVPFLEDVLDGRRREPSKTLRPALGSADPG